MRFLLSFVFVAALTACNPEPSAGPRLDLVGSTRFLSADRTTSTPADTFTTRAYAEMRNGDEANLKRVRISVVYSPTRNPFEYPVPYDPDAAPIDGLVYLDTLLADGQRKAAFQFTAGTRTTSGQEQWSFEAEDTNGNTSRRTFRVRLRRPDSTAVYHSYTLRLPAPTGPNARSYLALWPGLALPPYALRTHPTNQNLIDVLYLPLNSSTPSLAAPTDPQARLGSWANRRNTQLRRTALNETAFNSTDTEPELLAAFNAGTPFADVTRTGPLTKNQVLAFQTADSQTGLIFIQDFPTAPTAAILMRVRVTK